MAKALKMPKLPFVVEPRLEPINQLIGSDESGKFEIIRRGYLTVAEKNFVQTASGSDSAISQLHSLAGKIARKHGKKQVEVFTDLIGNSENPAEYLEEHQSEISEVMVSMITYQEKHNIIVCTCLLLYRIDPNWTIESTLELHPDIQRDLVELYNDEDAKSIEALENAKIEKELKTENQGKE
jgi:hypothetical protein